MAVLVRDHRFRLNHGDFTDGLDAVADLLTDFAITAARHRKEINEWARDGQSGARDAYQAGVFDERERHEAW